MNDLIKEFSDKARTSVPEGLQVNEWIEQYNKTFAELIIKECAIFANEHNEEVEGVHLGVGRAIKNHFGVQ